MIPNIIHQIWIQGYDNIPTDLKQQYDECQQVNNDFINMFWDEILIKKFLAENFEPKFLAIYEKCKFAAQKADIARYAILYTYGGIYLDVDMVCRKNLKPFLEYNFFFTVPIFYKIQKCYLNGIIGSRPRHPILMVIFENIFAREYLLHDVSKSTGPKLFYHAVTEYIKVNPEHDISIIDRKYLHPCTYNSTTCPYECEDCYIAHTGHSSWSSSHRIQKKIINNWKYILAILIFFILSIVLMIYMYRYQTS